MENKILKKYKAVTKRVETFFKTDNEMQIRKNWNHHQKEIWINRVNKCPTCNVKLTKKNCTKEHIHPLVLGGRESDENITPMCEECNKARNSVMCKFLGTSSNNKLRSNWPSNQEKINHFVIWCYVSLGADDENRHAFTDLERAFAKTRKIDFTEESVNPNGQSKKWYSGILRIGNSWLKKSKSSIDEIKKIEYTCLNTSCAKIINLPVDYQQRVQKGSQFRCPHCKTGLSNLNAKPRTNSSGKSMNKESNPIFDLPNWLSKNWQGPESSKEVYVKLKLAISEHEKTRSEPRNIRQVMHDDLEISKNSTVEQITSKLESIYCDIESKYDDLPITIEHNQSSVKSTQNSLRKFILSLLDEVEWISGAHLGTKITEYWKRNEYSSAQDFKLALGFENGTKTMKIVTSLCGTLISVKEEKHGDLNHPYIRKSPPWLLKNWKGGKESYNAFKQHISQVELEMGGERKIRDILKQDFEIPKSWPVEKILSHLDLKYSSS